MRESLPVGGHRSLGASIGVARLRSPHCVPATLSRVETPSAVSVPLSSSPVCARPVACWNRLTASRVAGPHCPSTTPALYPRSFSACCTERTSDGLVCAGCRAGRRHALVRVLSGGFVTDVGTADATHDRTDRSGHHCAGDSAARAANCRSFGPVHPIPTRTTGEQGCGRQHHDDPGSICCFHAVLHRICRDRSSAHHCHLR